VPEGAQMEIRLDEIEIPAYLMRKGVDNTEMAELKNSINDVGLINPVSVKKVGDRFVLIAGWRRYKACVELRREKIKAMVFAGTKVQDRAIMLHENLIREDINTADEADWVKAYIDAEGLSKREAGRRLNRSEAWVRERLIIADYPAPLKEVLRNRELPLTVVREFAKVKDENQLVFWCEYGIASGVSPGIARSWVQQWELDQQRRKIGDVDAPVTDVIPDFGLPEHFCDICKLKGRPEDFRFTKICNDCYKIAKMAMRQLSDSESVSGPEETK